MALKPAHPLQNLRSLGRRTANQFWGYQRGFGTDNLFNRSLHSVSRHGRIVAAGEMASAKGIVEG